jgi:metal-responsive CopG/Arc/MetJ family transcriptional regulator
MIIDRVQLQIEKLGAKNSAMKTVRIALEEGLLKEVDQVVENRFNSRAEFIDRVCIFFLRYLKEQQCKISGHRG